MQHNQGLQNRKIIILNEVCVEICSVTCKPESAHCLVNEAGNHISCQSKIDLSVSVIIELHELLAANIIRNPFFVFLNKLSSKRDLFCISLLNCSCKLIDVCILFLEELMNNQQL